MSIIFDAAQLAGAGANQIIAGHSAPGQAVNNGILLVTGKMRATSALSKPAAGAPKPASMVPGKARYELLRNLHRAQPKSEVGREAESLLRRQNLLNRAGLSRSVLRHNETQMDAVIKLAARQPALIAAADPGNRLRDAIAPASRPAQQRMMQRYDALKSILPPQPGALQTSTKTIALKQLPQLAMRPGFGGGKKKPLAYVA